VVAVPNGSGFLAMQPAGASATTSTVNFLTGRITANAAAVGTSLSGQVSVHTNVVSNVVVDLFGYFR
jgi:hypothetical protein